MNEVQKAEEWFDKEVKKAFKLGLHDIFDNKNDLAARKLADRKTNSRYALCLFVTKPC